MTAVSVTLALAGCAQPPVTRGGIVSTNPCADALLLRLAPARIAAISRYSQDPAATSVPLVLARRYRATGGTAEEVMTLRPALVLASTFTPPATRDAYARAGLRVVYLDSPTTAAASIAQVRAVAAAVGERGRGEVLAGEIERSLDPAFNPPRRKPGSSIDETDRDVQAAATGVMATGPRLSPGWMGKGEPSALLFLTGDLANGGGTLLDELLRRAGFRNAAADYGLTYSGRIPLETLAARPPAVVIAPDNQGRTAALRRTLLPQMRQARFPHTLVNCGGPSIVPALARLRAIRAALG